MKSILILVIVALIFASSVSAFLTVPAKPIDERTAKKLFSAFIKRYSKVYSGSEFPVRFEIFTENLKNIQKLNEESTDASYGITKFADLSPAEFKKMFLLKEVNTMPEEKKDVIVSEPTTLPTTFDWRSQGAVTPVKNQEQCGSCWAFSVTENIESMWILAGKATNATIDLAPQQIVDCDTSDDGCDGGNPPTAYEYIIGAGGQEPEKDYPYTAVDGTCKFNKADVVASISGWKYATTNKNEQLLQQNLYSVGPLSICVDAASWQYYMGGIIREICGQTLDHCVQLVGYNTAGTTPYWIVRNSWGADWGEQGYVYVEMWKNLCGITNEATSSIV